ncbi:hypothetical protein RvY_04084-6 [Ramazzottius varieornatus]|uniref:Receptor ligand binding region domain-containing protein n=1 Tax=Ramazzottius varieornatus TaxID=947166 RepID=A0A1D1UZN1_RAMVA|nr:hypothetical protein RvY_04084-6 [Ramazzottius varieornatus]
MILWIFQLVALLMTTHGIPQVVFLSLTMQEAGRDGYLAAEPVYDVILDRIYQDHQYSLGNTTHVHLRYESSNGDSEALHHGPNFLGKDHSRCMDVSADVSEYFFKYYFSNRELFNRPLSEQIILLNTPDCMDVLHEAANFVQELPGVVLMSTAPNNEFANNQRYPSVINLFGTPDDYFIYCLAFMAQKYGWQTLHLVCQTNGRSFTSNICARVPGTLQHTRSSNVLLVQSYIDVTNSTSFEEALTTAKTVRVSFVLLYPSLLRDFMIAARKENMTDGKHVLWKNRTEIRREALKFPSQISTVFSRFLCLAVSRAFPLKMRCTGELTTETTRWRCKLSSRSSLFPMALLTGMAPLISCNKSTTFLQRDMAGTFP